VQIVPYFENFWAPAIWPYECGGLTAQRGQSLISIVALLLFYCNVVPLMPRRLLVVSTAVKVKSASVVFTECFLDRRLI